MMQKRIEVMAFMYASSDSYIAVVQGVSRRCWYLRVSPSRMLFNSGLRSALMLS
jgi:hypothetical protein